MAAFFIAQYSVNDPALYAEYSAGAGPPLLNTVRNWWHSMLQQRPSRVSLQGDKPSSSSSNPQKPQSSGITPMIIRPWSASVSLQPVDSQ